LTQTAMVKNGLTDLRNDGPKKVKRTALGAPIFDEKAKIGQSIRAETLETFHQTCWVRSSLDMSKKSKEEKKEKKTQSKK
jgi:hypothetical protein